MAPHSLDLILFHGVFALFAGKAYAIFALLFGFTFYLQSHNQQLRGRDFGPHFLWRLVLLAAFCKWWLKRHRQGPLEHLWHRWTWLGARR